MAIECTLIPPLNNLSMLSISAGTGVGRGNVFNYRQLCSLGTIRPEDSRAVFCMAKSKSPTVWACPGVNSQNPLSRLLVSKGGNHS